MLPLRAPVTPKPSQNGSTVGIALRTTASRFSICCKKLANILPKASFLSVFFFPLAQCRSLWYKRSSRGQVKKCLSCPLNPRGGFGHPIQ
jgi:hypothetical protein